jgi:hypothetical protein
MSSCYAPTLGGPMGQGSAGIKKCVLILHDLLAYFGADHPFHLQVGQEISVLLTSLNRAHSFPSSASCIDLRVTLPVPVLPRHPSCHVHRTRLQISSLHHNELQRHQCSTFRCMLPKADIIPRESRKLVRRSWQATTRRRLSKIPIEYHSPVSPLYGEC